MLKSLFDFSCDRSVKGAVIFYIAWALLMLLVTIIVGAIVSVVFQHNGESQSYILAIESLLGNGIASLATLTLAVDVAKAKGSLGKATSILLILLAVALTMFISLFAGLIIPAYLTTTKKVQPMEGQVSMK